ncbi:subtilisin-like protease SBT3.6 [Lycium barbarum]|uniref:subtilisin-like protease SBT3.6 n=1 Tax=Lycium barbarum TaxID=112863 RepID=UPI00293E9683|nr:subtilisin-like protease SBT3.6 [Lycium barbarum]
MVYSYRYGFSGFAATLTDSQAKQIGELPGVVRVIQNHRYKTHTSRSWDFLGLSKNDPNNLLNKTNQGDGVIIGILDTGIYGDSEAFNDKGLRSNSISMERKIIGARWYIKGFMKDRNLNPTVVEKSINLSPLDEEGHGTHVASTAAGSYVNNLQFYGLNMGTVRGGAPLARDADLLACIDDAINDGVDVLSASICRDGVKSAEVNLENLMGIGSFHAVSHGIPFVAGGGNNGPESSTISNTSPWLINVAASNDDREIVTPLTLGNNETILVSLHNFYDCKLQQ